MLQLFETPATVEEVFWNYCVSTPAVNCPNQCYSDAFVMALAASSLRAATGYYAGCVISSEAHDEQNQFKCSRIHWMLSSRGCALKQNSRSLILKNNNGLLCERLYTSRQAVMKCFKNTSLLKDPMFLGGARQHWSQPGCSVLEVRGQLHRSRSRCSRSFSSAGPHKRVQLFLSFYCVN